MSTLVRFLFDGPPEGSTTLHGLVSLRSMPPPWPDGPHPPEQGLLRGRTKTMISFPGHGSPGPRCGDLVDHGCWSCKDYFQTVSHCMRKECPDCYDLYWAPRQGAHAAGRMTEFLNQPDYLKVLQDAERERWIDAQTDDDATVEEKRFYRIQTYHIQISFVGIDELHSKRDIVKYRKMARDIGRRHGLFGECTIPHARKQDDVGCHFHFLALAGFIIPGTDDGTDYILKVIPHEGSWYPRNFLDRFNVVKYACTHALITDDSHCVTWSGCVANNKFPGRAEYDHIPQDPPACPTCGGHQTFVVLDRDWWSGGVEVETWTAPDRPPPGRPQRSITEFVA